MAEENINIYLTQIQKIITSGNPKYMSYISKEYMKYKTTSPIIVETIESMIKKNVNMNPKSPYAVFLDKDGSMSLETIDSISKISNVEEFISKVQELSKYGIDFKNLTSEDLIIEGSEIAEELAKEVENAENLDEKEQEAIKEKAGSTLTKLTGLALLGGAIGGAARGLLSRIKSGLARLTGSKRKEENKQQDNNREEISIEEQERLKRIAIGKKNMQNSKSFEDVCPRHDVDEEKVLEESKSAEQNEIANTKNNDTYGDGDPDGDDIDI